MEKHLLPNVKRYFRTNLHTHSNISDGKLSPLEIKEIYKSLGYSVICITDHDVLVDQSSLSDDDFLVLNGTEINFHDELPRPRIDGKVYHMNFIAKRPDIMWLPGSKSDKYSGDPAVIHECMPIDYKVESVNAAIAKAKEKGFFVIYNHPVWSCQSYQDYAQLKGVLGVEIRNTECFRMGNDGDNTIIYKDLLSLGNRVYPVGADDMHNPAAAGGAWIMVGAKELTYESVVEALEQGDFYMSCGPEIRSLTIEDNILHIECSDAKKVTVLTHGRFASSVEAPENEWINTAEFDLEKYIDGVNGDDCAYIIVRVYADDGSYAITRAYYLNAYK